MRRPGWNPTRRNRNIGTERAGCGQDNRNVIPWENGSFPWTRLDNPRVTYIEVHGQTVPLVVEKTREKSHHACQPQQIAQVLDRLPALHVAGNDDIPGIGGVVLKQATRRQETLRPVWATLRYWADFGPIDGPTIYLYAMETPSVVRWNRSLTPDDAAELAVLRRECTSFDDDRRGTTLRFTLEAVRRVQLLRSLPHEVGHWAQIVQQVELPYTHGDGEWDELWARYQSLPSRERESFAERYAAEHRPPDQALAPSHASPEAQTDALRELGMRPCDFVPHARTASSLS